MRRIAIVFALVVFAGCNEGHTGASRSSLSLLEPISEDGFGIPVPTYEVEVKNASGQKEMLRFGYPYRVAIGDAKNVTNTFDQAPAGQVTYSAVFGGGYEKYNIKAAKKLALVVCFRGPGDWDRMKQEIDRIGGRMAIDRTGKEQYMRSLASPFTREEVENNVWGRTIPADFFISGALVDVIVGCESFAAGLTFAGIGPSMKDVWSTATASNELVDPYTGEVPVSVMGTNTVRARQVGAEVFRITTAGLGGGQEFLNGQISFAEEMVKQRVQMDLAYFLLREAFKKLHEERPDYLTERLHFRVGLIKKHAERLALEKGMTVVGKVIPFVMAPADVSPGSVVEALDVDTYASL